MSYLVPNWSVPEHVKAFSTARSGGASSEMYDSMNLGLHVGDDPERVISNRRKLKRDLNLPNEPIWIDQVHGTDIVDANSPISGAVDGTFSRQRKTVCVVMTADCLPLLLTNQSGDQVAAVHVGWRGMAGDIIEKAIALFDCPPQHIIAWAGPCIGPNKFEVGAEVRTQLGGPDVAYTNIAENKFLVNLQLLCKRRLLALGVANFSHSQACTYTDSERFFSHRRDGECGRMASLIWVDRES